MRLKLHPLLASAIATLAVLITANIASAQKTKTIEAGSTTITFGNDFIAALGVLDLSPRPVGPTRWRERVVNFPVVAGAIDLDTAASQILHSGGLTFSAGGGLTQMTLQSFILDTRGVPVITGLVSVQGKLLGRMRLFDLALPSGITLPLKPADSRIILKGVGVSLDTSAAKELNSVFQISAFTGGFDIGTAKIIIDLPGYDDAE